MAGLAATKNVDGLSLTMPHKIAGYQYCKTVSETSRMLGVISAIRRAKSLSTCSSTCSRARVARVKGDLAGLCMPAEQKPLLYLGLMFMEAAVCVELFKGPDVQESLGAEHLDVLSETMERRLLAV